MSAHPGDSIVLTAVENTTTTKVSMVDKTHKGVTRVLTGSGTSAVSFPEIGDLAWNGEGVANFATLTYSDSMLDGLPFGSYRSANRTKYNMETSTGTLQINTAAFASNLESFKTVFKHS